MRGKPAAALLSLDRYPQGKGQNAGLQTYRAMRWKHKSANTYVGMNSEDLYPPVTASYRFLLEALVTSSV